MNKKQPTIKELLQLVTIIALGVFFLVGNNIPVQALHKEEQALDKFDNIKEFADAIKKGDESKILKDDIPLLSMKASDIYKDADKQTQDCIDLAAKLGDSLADSEVSHCVDDVNFFQNKISNNSAPTTATSTSTTTSTDTGTNGKSTSTSDVSTTDGKSTSTTDGKSTSTSDLSTSGDVSGNAMINELVKTGKFTEDEAKDFVSKTMLNGADGASSSDNTQSTSSQDNANTQSSNNNSNKAVDYSDLKDLVHSIKNHVVDSDDITLTTFQDSGAFKGADQATQKCIDLAGKIGGKLGDQEIVHCSEDPSFYQNQISSNNPNDNTNNANDNTNNANDNTNNANDNTNNNNNNPDDTSN